MLSARWRSIFVALAAIAGSACECGGSGILGKVAPKIEISPLMVDFGDVPLGAKKHARLSVKNHGSAQLVLGALDIMAPFTATPSMMVIAPGGTESIDVVFTPPGGESMSGMQTLAFMGSLVVHSNDLSNAVITIPLQGTEVHGTISVRPTSIDFTNTAVGTNKRIPIFIANNGGVEIDGSVTTAGFMRPEHFTLSTLSDFAGSAPIALQTDAMAELDLDYHPIELGMDNGQIVFAICGADCGIEVSVMASAVQAVVQLDPPFIDFGNVGIGQTVSKAVTVKNTGSNPVNVLGVSTTGGADLSASPVRPLPTRIDGNSSTAINLDFTPSSASMFQGELLVRTDDPAVPVASVRVTGGGQGPLFVVQPSSIDFGVQRTSATARRGFLLLNNGSADVQVLGIKVSGAAFGLADVPGLPARLGSGESITGNATFTPTSMGEFMGTMIVNTDDPATSTTTVSLQGGMATRLCELDAANTRIVFGLLPVGSTRTRNVIVTNVGSDVCQIVSSSFRAPVDPAITFQSPVWPVTLMPNDHFTLQFSYTPTMMTESSANFVMTTSDPVFPERHILLEGSAMDYADVFVQPRSLDFGSVFPMCSAGTRSITIFNAGDVGATIDNVSFTDSTSEFTMSGVPNAPFPIIQGSSQGFSVAYEPVDVGQDVDAVEIDVRDHPFPIIVPIQGAGTMNPRVTDQFTQSMQNKVDVLFIMGNSDMGADLQPGLAQNVSSFIQATQLRQVDFHIGVTSTDINPVAGQLVGPVITSFNSNVTGAFQMEVNATPIGLADDDEESLKAMAGAFQLAQQGVAPNNMLFRPDARVVIIIITDDDDTSPDTPLHYFSVLRSNSPQGFTVAVVSGQASGCGDGDGGGPMGGAEAAPRLEQFVALTMGQSISECGDWATSLSQLGALAFGLPNRFFLSKHADNTKPIDVSINGSPAPMGSWTYDAQSGSIVFMTAPPAGSTITVDYTPAC
jgi:hypothetical protein